MKTIEYKISYTGIIGPKGIQDDPQDEVVRVTARDINSGFAKALRRAHEPLGSGLRREIVGIVFWQVCD